MLNHVTLLRWSSEYSETFNLCHVGLTVNDLVPSNALSWSIDLLVLKKIVFNHLGQKQLKIIIYCLSLNGWTEKHPWIYFGTWLQERKCWTLLYHAYRFVFVWMCRHMNMNIKASFFTYCKMLRIKKKRHSKWTINSLHWIVSIFYSLLHKRRE